MSLRGRVNDFVTKVQNLYKRADGQKILEYTSSLWMTPIYFLVIPNQAEPKLKLTKNPDVILQKKTV